MPRAVILRAPRTLAVEEVPERPLGADEVLVRTLFSGVSTGTELAAFRGTSPFVHKRWDAQHRLFVTDEASSDGFPVRDLGYEEVGEVLDVGAGVPVSSPSLAPGTIVYGTWGHRTHAVLEASYARERVLPDGLEPIQGIWSHLGPIALNGVLDSQARIGETVAVFGLGVVGQVVAQLLTRSGARVIGIDLLPSRLELAGELGSIAVAIDGAQEDAGLRIKELTAGRGADVAMEVTGAPQALHDAIRATAYGGRVVSMGFQQGEAVGLRLGEEFHHNRIALVCSQISGVAPELSFRWDRSRLVRTFMRLQVEGAVDARPLITHRYPFERVREAFQQLDSHPAETLQVVLEFDPAEPIGRPAPTGEPR